MLIYMYRTNQLPSRTPLDSSVGKSLRLTSKIFRFITSDTYSVNRLEQDQLSLPSARTIRTRKILKIVWIVLFPIRFFVRNIKKVGLFFGVWQKINQLRLNLTSLGLSETAYAELANLAKSNNKRARKFASWNMAWWHANQLTKTDAEKCLEYLCEFFKHEADPEKRARGLVLQAECAKLVARNQKEATDELINHLATYGDDPNLYLALASLATSKKDHLNFINKALELSHVAPVSLSNGKSHAYDRLEVEPANLKRNESPSPSKQPRVSVIIPTFNAAETLHTAIESMLAQTWRNIEIIIANDCSTDDTVQIAESYAKKDERIKIVTNHINNGPYVARNEALKIASGEYITCNDSDDWSHPQKIERQVQHLIDNPNIIANTSELARAYNDISFYRRGLPGMYIQINMSSLMFRRKPVLDKLGSWDSVRFGADSEFIKRLRLVFGNSSVVELKNALYSFLRQSDGSLTGSKAFGYHGFMMGARKEYTEAQSYYHSKGDSLRYDFPMKKRPFAVPYPMLPDRLKNTKREFDVVIAADFRQGGDNIDNALELIEHYKKAGKLIGLVPLYRFMKHTHQQTNDSLREVIDGRSVQVLVYGEHIECQRLVVLDAQSLQYKQTYIPELSAKHAELDEYSAKNLKAAENHFKASQWTSFEKA